MAVAYVSVQTTAWEGNDFGQTIVITKPTSLAVGDLMIAHIGLVNKSGGGTPANIDAPAGWTSLGEASIKPGSSWAASQVFYIVATSTETAATDFTFTNDTGAGFLMAGAIYRITGQGDVSQLQLASATVASGSTPTYTNTVTPNYADSLLLFLAVIQDNQNSGSATGYAITTSNPTWTERYDMYGDGSGYFGVGAGDGLMVGATASRPEVTATGDSTVTFTTFGANSVGFIVVVPPVVSVSNSPSVLDVVSSIQEPTVTGDADVTVSSPEVVTMSLQAPTVTTPGNTWADQSKSTTTWTDQTKN